MTHPEQRGQHVQETDKSDLTRLIVAIGPTPGFLFDPRPHNVLLHSMTTYSSTTNTGIFQGYLFVLSRSSSLSRVDSSASASAPACICIVLSVGMDARVSSQFVRSRKPFFAGRKCTDEGFFAGMGSYMSSLEKPVLQQYKEMVHSARFTWCSRRLKARPHSGYGHL